LRRLFREVGATPDKEVIAYCHGGIRAAHSMFALKKRKRRAEHTGWLLWLTGEVQAATARGFGA
jgi:3-mercaptopyruvate sulfurtransferase SseA